MKTMFVTYHTLLLTRLLYVRSFQNRCGIARWSELFYGSETVNCSDFLHKSYSKHGFSIVLKRKCKQSKREDHLDERGARLLWRQDSVRLHNTEHKQPIMSENLANAFTSCLSFAFDSNINRLLSIKQNTFWNTIFFHVPQRYRWLKQEKKQSDTALLYSILWDIYRNIHNKSRTALNSSYFRQLYIYNIYL